MTEEHFDTAQHLANSLLPPANALRLSISLEHAAFLWECVKQYDKAVRLAGRAVRTVYNSKEGLDDEEFADASALVQNLAAIVKRGKFEGVGQPSQETLTSPNQPVSRGPLIDRTIAVSPTNRGYSTQSPIDRGAMMRSPERLSTVPEDASAEATSSSHTLAAMDPPISRLSSRSGQRRASSTTSDKAAKRRAAEQAEEIYRRNSASNRSNVSAHSRIPTPSEGYVRRSSPKKRKGSNG